MPDRINRRHSIRYKNTNVDGNADKLKSSLLTKLIILKEYENNRIDNRECSNDNGLMWMGISKERE
jgi:hypothetical protein